MKINVVVDPLIFFVNYQGKWEVNPIVYQWLLSIKAKAGVQVDIVFLSPVTDKPALFVHTNNFSYSFPLYQAVAKQTLTNIEDGKYTFPFNPVLLETLSSHAKACLNKLFNHSPDQAQPISPFVYVNRSKDSPTGIAGFAGDANTIKNEILVITARDFLVTFFKDKPVTLVKMDDEYQPILDSPLQVMLNQNKFHIYCDFDNTLNDSHAVSMFKNLVSKQETFQGSDDLRVVKKNTITFLKNLKQHPQCLITQRGYLSDQSTVFYNCATQTVDYINAQHQLNIRYDEDSFLNGSGLYDLKLEYPSKVEIIYQIYSQQLADDRPEQILLNDDDWLEAAKAEEYRPRFLKLGIHFKMALVSHPLHFTDSFINEHKHEAPSIYAQLQQLSQTQVERLERAFAVMYRNQSQSTVYSVANILTNLSGIFSNGVQLITSLVSSPEDQNKSSVKSLGSPSGT